MPTPFTRLLLGAGVILTPVFYLVALVLAAVSDGFDLRKHAISALSLGPYGGVQQANFVVSGLLALACAWGLKRSLGKGVLPLVASALVGVVGVGLATAGVFSTDPAFGFPKGAPDGFLPTPSGHAAVHSLAFYGAFTALTVAGLVFESLFRRTKERGWALYSLVSALATPSLIALGMTVFSALAGIAFALAGLVSLGWLSLVAYHTRQVQPRN